MPPSENRSHFAVPIFTRVLDGFDEQRVDLVRFILALQAETPGISVSNRGGFHSTNDLHRRDVPAVVWLRDAITVFARDALRERHGAKVDAELTALWANVAGRGAWHSPHEHFPAHWSGVFYVSAQHCLTTSAGPTEHERGGKIEFLNPIPLARAFGLPSSVTYTPRDGLALLFPGPLVHLVHPNPVDELRISVSFNVNVNVT